MTKTCPRQQSILHPCVVAHGPVCYTLGSYRQPMCAGCDATPLITGVEVDIDALTREFDAYNRGEETSRDFPIPTTAQIRARKGR